MNAGEFYRRYAPILTRSAFRHPQPQCAPPAVHQTSKASVVHGMMGAAKSGRDCHEEETGGVSFFMPGQFRVHNGVLKRDKKTLRTQTERFCSSPCY